jgi:hypothetical protein
LPRLPLTAPFVGLDKADYARLIGRKKEGNYEKDTTGSQLKKEKLNWGKSACFMFWMKPDYFGEI